MQVWFFFFFIVNPVDHRCLDTRGISPRTKNILFLATLIGLNLLNYMDRFTVAGTLIDIQNYFKIKDADAGLIVVFNGFFKDFLLFTSETFFE